MAEISDSWYFPFLVCPDCRSQLNVNRDNISCSKCTFKSGLTKVNTAIDLRPINPRKVILEFARTGFSHSQIEQLEIQKPEITYSGPSALRDSRELVSQMQCYLESDARVLDLGCGPRDQVIPIEYLGYQYIGLDYSNLKADILGDAHALPFEDNTFDCVLSYAVLEHLYNPHVALCEIERVLKPNGTYIGTVSQGEPFHDSYFHHTSWGLISLVGASLNLSLVRIWPSIDTLNSLSRMGRYPRVIKWLLSLVDKLHSAVPQLAPRRMKWTSREKALDELHKSASICFVIQKRS